MKTGQITDDIYEASKSWEQFRKKDLKKSVNELLDWRLELMERHKKEVFDCHRIYTEYEIEATDKLLDKANELR